MLTSKKFIPKLVDHQNKFPCYNWKVKKQYLNRLLNGHIQNCINSYWKVITYIKLTKQIIRIVFAYNRNHSRTNYTHFFSYPSVNLTTYTFSDLYLSLNIHPSGSCRIITVGIGIEFLCCKNCFSLNASIIHNILGTIITMLHGLPLRPNINDKKQNRELCLIYLPLFQKRN